MKKINLKHAPNAENLFRKKLKNVHTAEAICGIFFEKHPIIVAILVLFAIGYLFPSNNESNNENIKQDSSDIIKNVSNGDNTNKIDNDQYLRTRYAHTNINIRKGPSTDTKVITTIGKGTEVQIGATEDGWAPVYLNGTKEGYIYAKLLKMYPPPKIEVTSFSWYKDPSFGIDGSVIYTVEFKNNTDEYISSVRYEFSTYDGKGNLIDTNTSYVDGLSPYGTRSDKGYATYFGEEERAKVQVISIR